MAVSKRTRYEVLRRDNHTCRYCGGRAPEATLTVDHVVPSALGGSDDPSNLVAACRDCNAGKTSSQPDAPTLMDVAAAAQRWDGAKRDAQENGEFDRAVSGVDRVWHRGTRPDDWQCTVERFVEDGLTATTVVRMATIAQNKRGSMGWRWAYFCGCCRNRLHEAQAKAAATLGAC